MNDIDLINRLFEEIGKRDGLVGLRLSADNTAGIRLKNDVDILFEYVEVSRRLYVYTPLMTIADADRQRLELFEALLECNFLDLGSDTGGLALFRRTRQVVYQLAFDVRTLTSDGLDRGIDAVIAMRSQALRKVEGVRTAARPAGATAGRLAVRPPPSTA